MVTPNDVPIRQAFNTNETRDGENIPGNVEAKERHTHLYLENNRYSWMWVLNALDRFPEDSQH
jgi:hypothetical protein